MTHPVPCPSGPSCSSQLPGAKLLPQCMALGRWACLASVCSKKTAFVLPEHGVWVNGTWLGQVAPPTPQYRYCQDHRSTSFRAASKAAGEPVVYLSCSRWEGVSRSEMRADPRTSPGSGPCCTWPGVLDSSPSPRPTVPSCPLLVGLFLGDQRH